VLDKKLNKFHFDIFRTMLDENGQWSKPEALPAVGVGEDNLVTDCGDGVPCPNFDHQKNRRSDFIVVGSLK